MSIMDSIMQGGRDAAERMGARIKGLRGQAAAPAGAVPEAAASAADTGTDYSAKRAAAAAKAQAEMAANARPNSGSQVTVWNEVTGQRPGPAAQAQPSGGTGVTLRDPSVRPAGPVYEGAATKVPGAPSFAPAAGGAGSGGVGGISGGANGVPPAATPPGGAAAAAANAIEKPSLLRRGFGALGTAAGAVQAGLGIKDAFNGNGADAADNIAMGLATAAAPGVGIVGNMLRPLRDMAIKAGVDRFYPEVNPAFTQLTRDAMAAKPGVAQAPAQPAAQQAPSYMDVNTNQGPKAPEAVLAGNAVPVSGEGVFKVGKNPAQGIRTAAVAPPAQPQSRVAAGISQLADAVIGSRALENKYTKDLNLAKIAATAGKTAREVGKDNRAGFERSMEDHVRSLEPAQGTTITGKPDPMYDSAIKQKTSQLKTDIEYSVAQRKGKDAKSVEDLTPQEQQQLFLLDKVKRRVGDARDTTSSKIRDFFGFNRADSKNLYSYEPKIKELATLPGNGGYVVTLANGNRLTTTDLNKGQFRMFGSNDPVDADMDELLRVSIARHQKDTK